VPPHYQAEDKAVYTGPHPEGVRDAENKPLKIQVHGTVVRKIEQQNVCWCVSIPKHIRDESYYEVDLKLKGGQERQTSGGTAQSVRISILS